jgi:formylglycine-generating enzyme required for sulfatase activity
MIPPNSITMKKLIISTLVAVGLIGGASVKADIFGTGANQFNIDFVTIGNPGNVSDPATGYGAVPYSYRIGKYTISQNQVNAAIANGLSNVSSDTYNGSCGAYYTLAGPACDISWFSAAAFVNWLNTNSGYPPAYNLTYMNGGWSMDLWPTNQAWTIGGTNLFRNAKCHYFLPSDNEWYKAAYYDPNLNGGGYWPFTTGSSNPPTNVAGHGWAYGGAGTNFNTVVYGLASWENPADVTLCGGLSPYGTMGQGGNVRQWVETTSDGLNSNPNNGRSARGYSFLMATSTYDKVTNGWFPLSSTTLNSSIFQSILLTNVSPNSFYQAQVGFRVASTDIFSSQIPLLSIITQPTDVSLTATNSQSATFSVVVTNGVPPYAYQWMKDGVDLTNQTNASLILSNAGANTDGYYSCDVTDQNGTTVTSSNAALNISGVPFWLWQGLVAYYPFNGDINDYSGNGNNATNHGSTFTRNRFGLTYGALKFNGITQYVECPYLFSNYQDRITISTWAASTNSSPADTEGIVYLPRLSNNIGGALGISIDHAFNNDIVGGLNNDPISGGRVPGSTNLPLDSGESLKDMTWKQITLTLDGSIASVYVNGALKDSKPYNNNGLTTTDHFQIGRAGIEYGWYFDGSVSDVRIYNRALSSNEVAQLYTLESPPTLKPQTITFPPLSPVIYGIPPFTLTATASSGLPVSFSSSSTNISISGSIVTVLGTGMATIVASQSGNSSYAAAPSITNTLVVNGPDSRLKNQTITFSALKPKVWTNAPFALTAKASSILPITYTSSDATVATVSNGILTPVGVGTTTITAYQVGNTIYNPAKPVSQQQVITQATQKITFPAIASHTFGDTPFTLSATSTSSLPITYSSSASNIATVSGNVVTIVGAGTAKITASQGGNALYTAATPVSQSLKVAKANQTVIFNPSTPLTYTFGGIVPLNATATSGQPITYSSSKPAVIMTVNGTSQGVMQGKGTTTITATQAGNANFNKASASATITLQ